jgi:hypothetical protein
MGRTSPPFGSVNLTVFLPDPLGRRTPPRGSKADIIQFTVQFVAKASAGRGLVPKFSHFFTGS